MSALGRGCVRTSERNESGEQSSPAWRPLAQDVKFLNGVYLNSAEPNGASSKMFFLSNLEPRFRTASVDSDGYTEPLPL